MENSNISMGNRSVCLFYDLHLWPVYAGVQERLEQVWCYISVYLLGVAQLRCQGLVTSCNWLALKQVAIFYFGCVLCPARLQHPAPQKHPQLVLCLKVFFLYIFPCLCLFFMTNLKQSKYLTQGTDVPFYNTNMLWLPYIVYIYRALVYFFYFCTI